ncbi:hypothetical protein KQH60_05720 [Mycetohabitans sp. B8]|nr:hypothetical protein [Mycetohabitans sp. B8]MCG1042082.1 hypothetical protein [Mycetohabitans sp. B8]
MSLFSARLEPVEPVPAVVYLERQAIGEYQAFADALTLYAAYHPLIDEST